MAPMSLLTYEESRPWARAIKDRVTAREMPPWFLDKTVGIQKFINDVSLTDEEIDIVVRWVDAGAPAGDAKDSPTPRQWPSGDLFRLESQLGPAMATFGKQQGEQDRGVTLPKTLTMSVSQED